MSFDLCQVPKASRPYYIENISMNIYTIEELCFYLYNNVYLIDKTIVNEVLCDWLRDELGLKKLYRQLYEHLEKDDGIVWFILPIFREIGYLNADQIKSFQDALSRIEVQPEDTRRKMKGDYLVRCRMYQSAVTEYTQILAKQNPGALGAQFYAQIWNNLGCAYAGQFLFADAADCFEKAWKISGTKETLRKYVSVLPLFMTDGEYKKALTALGADTQLAGVIQEYNLEAAKKAQEKAEQRLKDETDMSAVLEEIRTEYRRSARS